FRAGVNISGNEAVARNFQASVPADANVLADFRDLLGAQGLQVRGRFIGDAFGDLIAEGAEGFVLGDKVGLAVDLDQNAEASARLNVLGDDALAGFASGFLRGGRNPFFAEN